MQNRSGRRTPAPAALRKPTDLADFLELVASAEDWMGFGADEREPEEPMKRLTIDVPVELHRRVRAACAKRG
jgi:hypothetical protein